MKKCLLLTLLISFSSLASPVDLNFIMGLNTQRIERGALTWNRPLMIVAPGITLWNKLRLGPGLVYFKQIKDHLIEFSTQYRNGNEPNGPIIKIGKDVPKFMFLRKTSWELGAFYRYAPLKKTHYEIRFHREISRHHGYYTEIGISQPILPLTRLTFKRGFGDRHHNSYLYGAGAHGGFTHFDLGLRVFLPFWAKDNIIVFSHLNWSKIDNGDLKNRYHVQGHDSNTNFNIMMIYDF